MGGFDDGDHPSMIVRLTSGREAHCLQVVLMNMEESH